MSSIPDPQPDHRALARAIAWVKRLFGRSAREPRATDGGLGYLSGAQALGTKATGGAGKSAQRDHDAQSRSEALARLRALQGTAQPRSGLSFGEVFGDSYPRLPGSRQSGQVGGMQPVSAEAKRAAEAIHSEVADTLADEIGAGGVGSSRVEQNFVVHFHPTDRRISAVRGPKRAAEKGQAITRFDRLPVDGRVFDRKRPGGSVLIDQSGSMSLTYDDVAQAIEHFPALTVAGYSGRRNGGTLCVYAEKGQLGELGDCQHGGGNDVDIESLVWLSKQPEPRIWVSDGWVCGGLVNVLGDEQARAVITSLCQRKNIVRVATFDDAVKVLRRGITRGVAVEPRDEDFLRVR